MNIKSKFTKLQIISLAILFLIIFGLIGGKYYYGTRNDKVTKRQSVDRPIAFYFNMSDISNLTSVSEEGVSLPDNLIIPPGVYKVYGNNYNLTKEGLYRFLDPTKSNQQRIVYKEDVDSLLSAVSWIASHGLADKNKTKEELMKKALTDKLNINCGVISLFILKNFNIKSRIVTTLTLEDPWNSYDTGHTLVEVYKKDGWQVYDLDNNVVFKKGNHYLNFLEFFESIKNNNDYTIEKIADDAEYSVGGSVKEDYDYSFYFEAILSNEVTLRDWYKKVIQVPLIGEDSTYYFFDEKNRPRIESYAPNYKFLPEVEFIKRFYSD